MDISVKSLFSQKEVTTSWVGVSQAFFLYDNNKDLKARFSVTWLKYTDYKN